MHLNAPGNLHDEGNCEDCRKENCTHSDGRVSLFENGICKLCKAKCEHDEIEEGHCLDCGEFVLNDIDEDYFQDRWMDNQLDKS